MEKTKLLNAKYVSLQAPMDQFTAIAMVASDNEHNATRVDLLEVQNQCIVDTKNKKLFVLNVLNLDQAALLFVKIMPKPLPSVVIVVLNSFASTREASTHVNTVPSHVLMTSLPKSATIARVVLNIKSYAAKLVIRPNCVSMGKTVTFVCLVQERVFVNMELFVTLAKIVQERVFVNMVSFVIFVFLVMDVGFVNTMPSDIIARLVKEKVFVHMDQSSPFAKRVVGQLCVNMDTGHFAKRVGGQLFVCMRGKDNIVLNVVACLFVSMVDVVIHVLNAPQLRVNIVQEFIVRNI